jgi:uncharacterized protein
VKNSLEARVASIAGHPGRRLEIQLEGRLAGLATSGSAVPDDQSVSFEGHVETIDGGFVVEGVVKARWQGECRRCLGPAEGDIRVDVREVFERQPAEGETYGIDGDAIDLEPMMREAVMLELPVAPLCRPDCAGLCPSCGANRNETECGHSLEVKDDRWAALDQLKEQSSE